MVTAPHIPSPLIDVLRRLTEPLLAGRSTHSLAVRLRDEVQWLSRAADCPHEVGAPFLDGKPGGDGWRFLHISGGGDAAEVWVRGPAHAGLNAVLCLSGQIADLEQDRDHLCEELLVSHESLASLYELSDDPALVLEPERALQAIIERAVAFQPGLRAIMWLADGEALTPARWEGTAEPSPRPRTGGIVGRALEIGQGLIVNGWRHDDETAPELALANRVAISPLLLKSGPIGALQVWHDDAGTFDSRHMGHLRALCALSAMIVDHDRLRQRHLQSKQLEHELDIAATIQETLLIGRVPDLTPGLDVAAVSVASRQVDGDFLEFFTHDDDVTDVIVGDVMGKGLPAAMVGAAIKNHFTRHAATSVHAKHVGSPDEVVARVHRDMAESLIEVDTFATGVYTRFRPGASRLEYVDWGHTPGLHYRRRTGRVDRLRKEWDGLVNLPLGMHASTQYETADVHFVKGDVFVLYSDGMTEATGWSGEMFGVERLAAALVGCAALPAADIAARLRDVVTDFAGPVGLSDDLSCVVVRIEDGPALWKLELPALMSSLSSVRRFVLDRCRALPGLAADEQTMFDVQLAVVESASNVIRHAWPEGETGCFALEIQPAEDHVTLELRDTGAPFDPLSEPEPDLSHESAGGLGIFLVRNVMDDVRYERTPQGENVLTLVKGFGGE
ncbi:MAG: hypothetical protein CMJ83_04130 [Planctomycetes bacterium]|nr:hypothetical protein [Planctomycetota bacterium]